MRELKDKVASLEDEMFASIKESVAIRSVEAEPEEGKPFGAAVDAALQHALGVAAKMGLKTKNLDGYVGYAEYGEGEEYVAVLGHLDIVPEGDGWQYPPFACEIADGKMYGRGVLDDKGPLFAALYGLKAIKELGLPLKKRIRVIFGTNEETGCSDMPHYLACEAPPAAGFTPDANFPVIHAEKGIVNFDLECKLEFSGTERISLLELDGGRLPNMVPDHCSALLAAADPNAIIAACEAYAAGRQCEISAAPEGANVRLTARGQGAHGSTPELGKNAAMLLVGLLHELDLEGAAGVAIAELQQLIGAETDGMSLGVACSDEPSGLLTNNLGILKLADGKLKATCNMRYPVTLEFEGLREKLEKRIARTGFVLICGEPHPPLYFPKEHPLVAALQRIFKEQTGIDVAPLAIGGGTYAKTMPNIVAYGPEFPGTPGCCHEPNEHMALQELRLSAQIYAQALYELAG